MTTDDPRPGFGLPSDRGGRDLGLFLPMANGGWILSRAAPPIDGGYASNLAAARTAEAIGLDFVMSMAKYRGYGGDGDHWGSTLDSPMLMAALAQATRRVKLWATIHTLLQNPAVAAKTIATLDQASGGRAGLNVVTGAYAREFAQMGAWPEGVDHDGRYAIGAEWLGAVKALWAGERVTTHGHYRLDDCVSAPRPTTRPFLVCAGSSAAGVRFAAREADALFLSGGCIETLAAASDAAKAERATLRTYAMMTLVFGDTDAAAETTARRYREGLDEGALAGMMRAYGVLDAETGTPNAFVANSRSGFMTPWMAGSPATIAARLVDLFEATSLDGLMLIFDDYAAGLATFGEHVLPVLRARFPEQAA